GIPAPSAHRGAPPLNVRSTRMPSAWAASIIASYGPQFTDGYAAGSDATKPTGAVRACALGATCAHTTTIRTMPTPSARNVFIVPTGSLYSRVGSWMIEIWLPDPSAAGASARALAEMAAATAAIVSSRALILGGSPARTTVDLVAFGL